MESETLFHIKCTSQSPELYPIKHLWEILVMCLNSFLDPIRKPSDQIVIDDLIHSVDCRCRALVTNRGNHTRYWQITIQLFCLKKYYYCIFAILFNYLVSNCCIFLNECLIVIIPNYVKKF